MLSGQKTYLIILRLFWGQKKDDIRYKIMEIPHLLGCMPFPLVVILRAGDSYNFRVSVSMNFSSNIFRNRKMLVCTFPILLTRHLATVIAGTWTRALTLQGKAGTGLTR